MEQQEVINARFARVAQTLDERARRAVAASEAVAIGWGGITGVSRATGLSRTVIQLGSTELRGTVPGARCPVPGARCPVPGATPRTHAPSWGWTQAAG